MTRRTIHGIRAGMAESGPSVRILALVTDAFGGYGGIARYNCDFLTALAGVADHVEIFVQPRIGPPTAIQVQHNIRQARPILSRALFALTAARQALRTRPDIILCGHIYHGPLAMMLAKLTGAKLISQLHGTEVWQPLKRRHLEPLLRSDLVLCVSRDTKARYRRQAGTTDNSFVLANMVGPTFVLGDRALAQQRFGVTGCSVLLSVARLDTRDGYKGQDRVIKALRDLNGAHGQPVVYLIAGQGEDRVRLEQVAHLHGVSDQVRFLGKVPDADLPDLYRAADLFVLPSTGEGFGIVYLEAMACGTPAVGLAVGGVPDPLGDGELGTLLPAGANLAAILQQLLQAAPPDGDALSSTVRSRFGQGAFRTRVAQAFQQLTRAGAFAAEQNLPADPRTRCSDQRSNTHEVGVQ